MGCSGLSVVPRSFGGVRNSPDKNRDKLRRLPPKSGTSCLELSKDLKLTAPALYYDNITSAGIRNSR